MRSICACAAEAVGLQLGWQPGIPAAARDVPAVFLLMLTFDILNILFVSVSRSIDNKEPWKNCFIRLAYADRKAILPQRTFLTVVAVLLSSHMGNTAFAIVFLGVVSLRLEIAFQKELVRKTEEAETDTLTKAHNVRYLQKWMNTELGIGLQQAAAAAMGILQVSDSNPFLVDGAKVDFGLSIGVASWPEHGETVLDAIRMADKAMYIAKNSGGNTVRSAADL